MDNREPESRTREKEKINQRCQSEQRPKKHTSQELDKISTNIVYFYYLAFKTNYVLYVKLKSMVIFHSKGFTGVCFNSLLYCKDKKL